MWQRFTERARRVVFFAQEEAARLGENYVGTEHLLLGLVRETDSVAARILDRLAVPLERIRHDIQRQVTRGHGNLGQDMQLTPRAKRVIDLAYDEARQLNNNYIGTEHILLGLIREGDGLAARVLVKLGAEIESTREIVLAMQEGEAKSPAGRKQSRGGASSEFQFSWVGHAMLSDLLTGGGLGKRLTPHARSAVQHAHEESTRLQESYLGTEHLLLGLLRDPANLAGRTLEKLGLTLDAVGGEVERRATRGSAKTDEAIELTPRAQRVFDLAYHETRGLGHDYIGTGHLLLALVLEGSGLAGQVLTSLGVELERARGELCALLGTPDAGPEAWALSLPLMDKLKSVYVRAQGASTERGAEQAVLEAVRVARGAFEGVPDFKSIRDITADQAEVLLALSGVLKATLRVSKTVGDALLYGRTVAMLFEKPSLRTRVTFDTGMYQLGGHAVYLPPSEINMGSRETVPDVARNLERWVDGIVARVFSHQTIVELAENAGVPVINALCDLEHPCQALSDLLTVQEHRGGIKGQKIVYVGDGNNVAHSLMLLGAKLGAHVVITGPQGYEPNAGLVAVARGDADAAGGSVEVVRDPREACKDADVIYTDVWTSMGQEDEAADRAATFAPYQVNEELAALAKPDYLFLHCLPAHRGEEVSAGVMDGPHSAVFDQAENRLHAQKAVLVALIK